MRGEETDPFEDFENRFYLAIFLFTHALPLIHFSVYKRFPLGLSLFHPLSVAPDVFNESSHTVQLRYSNGNTAAPSAVIMMMRKK